MDAESETLAPPPTPHVSPRLSQWYKLFDSDFPPRLGIEIKDRAPITGLVAFATGAFLGTYYGAVKASLRYRAENAHRFPTNATGWYQYHKSKNYQSMLGGIKDGMRMGSKLGIGAVAFCLFEETFDHTRRGGRDFLSTVTAGLSFSGLYSLLGILLP